MQFRAPRVLWLQRRAWFSAEYSGKTLNFQFFGLAGACFLCFIRFGAFFGVFSYILQWFCALFALAWPRARPHQGSAPRQHQGSTKPAPSSTNAAPSSTKAAPRQYQGSGKAAAPRQHQGSAPRQQHKGRHQGSTKAAPRQHKAPRQQQGSIGKAAPRQN